MKLVYSITLAFILPTFGLLFGHHLAPFLSVEDDIPLMMIFFVVGAVSAGVSIGNLLKEYIK